MVRRKPKLKWTWMRRKRPIPFSLVSSFQRVLDINHKPVLDILFNEPLQSFICILNWNDFYIRVYSVCSTEIQHFLRLFATANYATGNGFHSCNIIKKHKGYRFLTRQTNKRINIIEIWEWKFPGIPKRRLAGLSLISLGYPTKARIPVLFNSDMYRSNEWSPDAASTMKSNVFARACPHWLKK